MALLAQLIITCTLLLLFHNRKVSSSINESSTETAFAILFKEIDTLQAQIDFLMKRSSQSHSVCLGKVTAHEFYPYVSSIGIFTQVNTAHCQFRNTPTYLTSLGGMNSIWYIPGATAIYNATRIGFRVYLGPGDGIKNSSDLLEYAKQRGWALNWVGLEENVHSFQFA